MAKENRKIYIEEKKIPSHLRISEGEAKRIIEGKVKEIREYFRKSGFKRGVIGVSGGLDSAVAAVISVKALRAKNVYFLSLPYLGVSSKESLRDAKKLAKNLKTPEKNFLTLPINSAVDSSWKILKKFKGASHQPATGLEKIRKGNLMARERMKILFDLSQAFGAIVIGAEDRTEAKLGYFTLWGDQASGIEPIKNLFKSQVFQIAKYLKEIPKEILKKEPSPGLWKGQTAEKEIGANYLEADIVLSAIYDLKISKEEIIKKFKISKKKINLILKQAKVGEIKKSLPYILKNGDSPRAIPSIDSEIEKLVKEIILELKKKKIFLASMESCTGGGLINAITNVPGASEILKGGIVAYSNQEKIAHGVPEKLIEKYSPYSPQVALAMAWRATKEIKGSDLGVGITGILSRPDPKYRTKKIGQVDIAVIFKKKVLVRRFYFPKKEREVIKKMIILKTLEMIKEILK